MKVAISATRPDDKAVMEPRFGRCAYFVILETESGDWEAHPNPAADTMGGAGTQAAQFLASQGVQAVISGEFGPNAYLGLDAGKIKMYRAGGGTVQELVAALQEDRLEHVAGPTGPSRHGGRG